jgi:3-hydroxybutyrate dehydrogenase
MPSNGRTALVTGSTSGIGLAIAKGLAGVGFNIILTGLGDPVEMAALAHALETRHRAKAAFVPADLSKPADIRALLREAERLVGKVQVLVNNAGIQHIHPIAAYPENAWDDIIAINLSAAFHATKAVLPSMQQLRWGRIINIASAHGLVASAGKCAYVAAKHGLIGLTKVTALEAGEFGITANAICPGYTRTPLAEKQLKDRAAKKGLPIAEEEVAFLSEKQAIPVFTTPEQVADLAIFLCSDSASTLTGAALSMDGGWVAQ